MGVFCVVYGIPLVTVFVVVFVGSDVACDVGINDGAVRAACVSSQRALCSEGNGTHENAERRHASVSAEIGQSTTTGTGEPTLKSRRNVNTYL